MASRLQLIHEGHFGLGKCKLRAKDSVLAWLEWPAQEVNFKLWTVLKYLHSKCKQKPSKPLGQKIPVHHWSKLANDINHFEGASYLLIVNYTSRFLVVCKITSVMGVHFVNQCKLLFSEYEWPDTLISDNSPCYTSQAFTSVMLAFSVNHITSSPHHLQSNGLAEKYVQIVKCLFNKAKEEGKDLYKCLTVYHNNPTAVTCADSTRQKC